MSRIKEDKSLIVGLDIGTSKIVAIVAELQPEGTVKVIGLGQHISRGLKKGVVVNIESTMQSIQRALEEAELMADCKINNVYTGIAGSHIKSLNSHGMVKIKDAEVSQMDVDRVIETARAIALPADQQILHILTQEFIIDGQEDVREPLGMSGMKLEVKVHIVTGAVAAAQNIVKCITMFDFYIFSRLCRGTKCHRHIVGHLIASNRHHRGMTDRALFEYCNVCRTTTNIHQANA